MSFADILERGIPWLDATGADADIVVSTRVRLARNVHGHRFTHLCGPPELGELREKAVGRILDCPSFAGGFDLGLEHCLPHERRYLVESHLASSELVRQPRARSLVCASTLDRAVQVNEEDHLRLMAYRAGFDPVQALRDVEALESELETRLEFAYSEDFGYLTASPTNLGTGLRVSVMVHLPGLVLNGDIDKILNSLRQLQLTVRAPFGEGVAARAGMFQIANLVTLGRAEDTIVQDFVRHLAKVVQYERMARETLLARDEPVLRDLAGRAWGVVRHGHLLSIREAFERLGQVRLGVSLGMLPEIPFALLNRALVGIRGAHLRLAEGRVLDRREADLARAAFLRDLLA